MTSTEPTSGGDTQSSTSRGRGGGAGRSRGRGGVGKYLRARGRGRGSGRPAEFGKRLLLEGEGQEELDEEEAAELKAEFDRKYGRRKLGSNADRYVEEDPELGSDGEPIVEPEVDLTAFLEKQRQVSEIDAPILLSKEEDDDDEIDHTLAHLSIGGPATSSKKGKVRQVEWDPELERMKQEKEVAEANRDLKSRFRANTTKLKTTGISGRSSKRGEDSLIEAPPLPLPGGAPPPPPGDTKAAMEDFLDDLLA